MTTTEFIRISEEGGSEYVGFRDTKMEKIEEEKKGQEENQVQQNEI